jgi:hypothetical protein
VTPDAPTRQVRATRLLRWYPKDWRSRYGEEFVELLLADMEERPRCFRRALDVTLNGLLARASAAGLRGRPLDDAVGQRRSLAAAGGALSIFVLFALAIWSQLTIGWQWSDPDTVATSWAMVVMSASVVLTAGLCLASVVPIVWALVTQVDRQCAARFVRPLPLVVGGLAVLVVGTHHFANGWPGTGGHPWAHQGLVPGGVAAFTWAATLSITSYWAHPVALSGFPSGEVLWMAVSPVAYASVLVGAAKLVGRLDLSPRLLGYERRLAALITGAMATFFTGAALWIFDGGPGPRNLFHIGAIDIVDLVAMAAAMGTTGLAVRGIGSARPGLSAG